MLCMCCTCFNVTHMSKMVQIRNMPDEMHRVLKSRAAAQGMSLSDYLLQELRKSAEVPTVQEWLEKVRSREPVIPFSTEEAVRAERDSR
jgi:antitoxin FitA